MTKSDHVARIFIGCDPNDCDLEQMMVLEYSLRKHTSIPFEIEWMRLSRDPNSFWYSSGTGEGWRTDRWATPFSAFRWSIPARCNFQGRAFYTDTDVLFLSDIAEIWHHPVETGKAMLAAGSGSALRLGEILWDCAVAEPFLPPLKDLQHDLRGHKKLQRSFEQHPQCVSALAPEYSNLDGDNLSREALKALHYSAMGSQFSHRFSLPRLQAENRNHWFDGQIYQHSRDDLRELFDQYYHDALAAGYTLDQYRNPQPFGHFNKQTQKVDDSRLMTRRMRSFLKRIFGA